MTVIWITEYWAYVKFWKGKTEKELLNEISNAYILIIKTFDRILDFVAFVFNVNSICKADELTCVILGKVHKDLSPLHWETSRSKRRAINDRSIGERQFSEGKRTGAKSKSGKELMNCFRSDDIKSQKSRVSARKMRGTEQCPSIFRVLEIKFP